MNINNTDFMKKILFSMLSLLVSMTMFAQSEAIRKMNLVYDGQIVYSRSVSLIDSIKFVWEETGDDVIGGGEVDSTKQLYVGVVAFNQNVRQMPITSDVEAVKTFINEQTNDKDFTSFAYSVSKGNQMFDAETLPTFDKIFMLNFSDGTDNYSNMKWGEEGRMVAQRNVYDTARYDLQQRDGLNSYALGFGDDVGFGTNMQKVVMGSGSYFNVTSANELQSTFNEIAQSMLASAKNVLLKTNPGYYVDGECKYFRFTFISEGGYTDTIYAQMDGYPAIGYTLSISQVSKNYAYFDAPAKGIVDEETGKVQIPLNNLKFVKDGEELQYKFAIEVSFDGELYYEDVEEASTAEKVDKRIAVVLVLDCSTSMGDAFAPMKSAAVNFIETMEKMELNEDEPFIPEEEIDGITCHEAQTIALSLESGTQTSEEYTVKGYVTRLVGEYNEQYGDQRFWMADSRGGGDVFYAYNCKIDKAVSIGDYVLVTGPLYNYNGTPEIKGGNVTILESNTSASSAQVRFQKTDTYLRVTEMYLFDETAENLLVGQTFGSDSGISPYYEIPSGYAYPVIYYIEDLETGEGVYYYILDDPCYYYFEAGYKYTIVVSDDGTYLTYDVVKDGTFNAPAKIVHSKRISKSVMPMQKLATK